MISQCFCLLKQIVRSMFKHCHTHDVCKSIYANNSFKPKYIKKLCFNISCDNWILQQMAVVRAQMLRLVGNVKRFLRNFFVKLVKHNVLRLTVDNDVLWVDLLLVMAGCVQKLLLRSGCLCRINSTRRILWKNSPEKNR